MASIEMFVAFEFGGEMLFLLGVFEYFQTSNKTIFDYSSDNF